MIYNNYHKMMAVQSDTGTSLEVPMANCVYDLLSEINYFKAHKDLLMKQVIEEDPFNRVNVAALYLGKSKDTSILIHHHDAVDIFEYDSDKALSNDIKSVLTKMALSDEVRNDLENEDWWFGRGSADMKSGAAIQIEVLKKLSEAEFEGSILLLSVCDEENLSAGMREATKLLKDLHEKYGLNYKVAINSEPTDENLIYQGTVGKMMPVCYVRGRKSHIGDVYNGFNPMNILSRIHNAVELNPDFTDHYDGEVSPAPTWVHYRDRKIIYDASLPESAASYFSVLSLEKSPQVVIDDLVNLSVDAFNKAIHSYKACIDHVNLHASEKIQPLDVKTNVMTFEALKRHLNESNAHYQALSEAFLQALNQEIRDGKVSLPDATLRFIEYSVTFLDHIDPLVVIGLSGPYYPAASNHHMNMEHDFLDMINEVAKVFNRTYRSKHYFMGICDFSYTNLQISHESKNMIEKNLIGWGTLYDVPFDQMCFEIPMINIGPYGKDLHKITERVHSSCFEETPIIIENFIRQLHNKNTL